MKNSHTLPRLMVRWTAEPPKPVPEKLKGQATLLTDAQVLQCRGRREFQGWKPAALAVEYGVSIDYMYKLLNYQTRSDSKLMPDEADFKSDE